MSHNFGSVSFQRFLDLQPRNPHHQNETVTSTYMVVLNHLWNARYNAAAELASSSLAENPEVQQALPLYRAWIESLAQLGDQNSLAELGTLLLHLGRENSEFAMTHRYDFMGLRGLIHIELDQAPAVRLTARALANHTDSPYVLEFLQLAQRRGIGDEEFAIAKATCVVSDFFVWNTLAQELASCGLRQELNEVLRYLGQCFPGAPALNQYEYHLALDNGDWQTAVDCANKLKTSFSQHPDYDFYHAFAAFKAHDIDAAISTLESVSESRLSHDVDCASLLGECYAARAIRNESDDDAKVAIKTLTLAVKLMRRNGLEIDSALSSIRKMEERVGGHSVPTYAANQFREPRSWLVMLSPRRCEELMLSRDNQIEELHRPMGKEAAPGDVVLFVSKSAHISKKLSQAKQEWRVLAMYRVTSRPYWHPVHRWHSTLELIDRPEHPIPLDAQDVKSDIDVRGKRKSLPMGHHARFGVYSLDDSAMDLMISAVKRRSDGVNHENERRGVNLSHKKQS